MPQSTAVLLMEQYEAALTDAEALALHIAQENWTTPDQLRVISDLRVDTNASPRSCAPPSRSSERIHAAPKGQKTT